MEQVYLAEERNETSQMLIRYTLRMIRIERLTKADPKVLEELVALSRALHEDERTMSLEELKKLIADENALVMVAKSDTGIIGMATLYILHKIGNIKAYVEDVIVDASHRGEGLGEKLMHALLEAAKEKGVNSVSLTSPAERVAAHALYDKLGFKKRDTHYFRISL